MGHHLKDNIILMTSLSKNACRYLKLALVQVLTSNFQKEWLAHQNLTSHDDIVIKLTDKGCTIVIWCTNS